MASGPGGDLVERAPRDSSCNCPEPLPYYAPHLCATIFSSGILPGVLRMVFSARSSASGQLEGELMIQFLRLNDTRQSSAA